MHPLEAVRQFLTKENLHDVSVITALSGGADSVCLLSCLRHWKSRFGLHLSALHVQHQLRGAESQRDEAFCRQLCEEWQIPLQVVAFDVKSYALQHHLSIETAARECRYQAFSACQGFVASAHTASDNLETVIFRLARGTGLKGLCGIPARRDNLIRPLLTVSRTEILSYLQEYHLPYITDSSNLQDEYRRNFIRHHIIPPMNEIQPGGAEKPFMRTADILSQEEDFLEISAKNAFAEHLAPDGSLHDLQTLHPAIQRRCISLFLESHAVTPDYQQIVSIQKLLSSGGTAELVRGKLTAHVSRHQLFLQESHPEIPESPLQIGRNQIFSGYLLEAELISAKNSEKSERIYNLSANSALDYDIIKKYPVLHGRKPGLHLKPRNGHTISVKKWLQTLPVSQRQQIHYLSDENGLLWVQGLGVSERAAVTEQTRTILILHVHAINTQ